MRYQVIVSLDGDEIPKDKNRMFLSLLKHHITENDKRFLNRCMWRAKQKERILHFRCICRNVNF